MVLGTPVATPPFPAVQLTETHTAVDVAMGHSAERLAELQVRNDEGGGGYSLITDEWCSLPRARH